MPTLTSRPSSKQALSTNELMALVTPAVDVLNLLTSLIIYTNDSKKSVVDAQTMVQDALDCFKFNDYVVMAVPSHYQHELVYDVAVQPLSGSSYVSFKVTFQVRP